MKEFARKSGIDTTKLDGRPTDEPHSRAQKRKLIGGEISVPSPPTQATIKDEWKKMVESGEISIGVSCVSYKMEKFSTKNGQLEKTEVTVFGRKFPLLDLRRKFLAEHEAYMRLQTDKEIEAMSLDTLRSTADCYHHPLSSDTTIEELRTAIKHFQRSRSLIFWHDHGTLLGIGCILITAHVAYDPAVFYTQTEYEWIHCHTQPIQSLVERPKLHIIAAGSPSLEDQIAIIQDRIVCMSSPMNLHPAMES